MGNGKIRLLVTIADLAGGGAERECSHFLHALDRQVFDIHVCLWRSVFAYPCPDDLPVTVLHKTRPWHILRVMPAMTRLVDDWRPDIVFSVEHFTSLVTGSALARATHRPRWIARLVNPPEVQFRGWKRLWARRILPRADCLLTCSAGIAKALVDRLGLPPEKVRSILTAMDVANIRSRVSASVPEPKPPNRFAVLTVGSLIPRKNQQALLRAFARWGRQDTELWVLGQGALERELKELAGSLGIADRVRWLGFQDNPFRFFREADCFALTSLSEGLPTVIIEAMLCGLPVISTRCPYGPDELIRDGETGMLIPMHDETALAEALERLYGNKTLGLRLGAAAEEFAETTFGQGRQLQAQIDLLRELADKAKAGT